MKVFKVRLDRKNDVLVVGRARFRTRQRKAAEWYARWLTEHNGNPKPKA